MAMANLNAMYTQVVTSLQTTDFYLKIYISVAHSSLQTIFIVSCRPSKGPFHKL